MSGSGGGVGGCRGRVRLVIRGSLCLWLAWLSFEGAAASQELEPRAHSPSPVGVTFVVGAAVRLAIGGSLVRWLACFPFEGAAASQELEPRAYSPSPVGVTFVVGAA